MAIFDGVQYAIASALSNDIQRDISNLLNANGAVEVPTQHATHVITPTLEFEGARNVSEICVLVTPVWVERSQVLGKMQDPIFFSPDESKLFSGVHATTSGISSPDLEIAIASIQALGGQYSSNYTRSTTHLISTTTTSTKYIAAMGHRAETGIRVVVPHWLNDCTNIQRRLPEEPYEWPHPLCLSGDQITKTTFELDYDRSLLFQSLNSDVLREAQLPIKEQLPDPQVLRGRKIYLSSSLGLGSQARKIIEAGIQSGNGQLTDSVEDAGVLVTRYREGEDYVVAHNKGITIGTLEWLKHVERTGVFYSPTDQLLHYPVPSIPIPGFSKHEITISNYTGPARDYLKKLISLMGGRYTTTLSANNTVVIAAYVNGAKTDKAREWSTPITNHIWLEDCFLEWACLPVGQPKYLHYPMGVDWSIILGKKHLGRVPLEDAFQQNIKSDSANGLAARVKNRNWTDDRSTTPTKVKISDAYHDQLVEETKLTIEPSLLPKSSMLEAMEVERSLSGAPNEKEEEEDIETEAERQLPPRMKATRAAAERGEIVRATSDFEFSDAPLDHSPMLDRSNKTKAISNRKGKGKGKVHDITDAESDKEEEAPKLKPIKSMKKLTTVKSSTKEKAEESEQEQEEAMPKPKQTAKKKVIEPTKAHPQRRMTQFSEEEGEDDDAPLSPIKKLGRQTTKVKAVKKAAVQEEESQMEDEYQPGPSQVRPSTKTSRSPKRRGQSFSESGDPEPKPRPAKKLKAVPKSDVPPESDEDSDAVILNWHPTPHLKKSGRESHPPKDARSSGKRKGKGKAPVNVNSDEDETPIRDRNMAMTSTGTTKRKLLTASTTRREGAGLDEEKEPISTKKRTKEKAVVPKPRKVTPIELSADEDDTQTRKRPQSKKKKAGVKDGVEVSTKPVRPTEQQPSPKRKEKPLPELLDGGNGSVVEITKPSKPLATPDHSHHHSIDSFGPAIRSPSRRSAATKAGEKLRDNMEDMNHFRKEMTNGRVRGTWEKAAPVESIVSKSRSVRLVSRKTDDAGSGSDEGSGVGRARKRKRDQQEEKPSVVTKKKKPTPVDISDDDAPKSGSRSKTDPKKVKVVTTQVIVEEPEQKRLKRIGVRFVEEATKCTHLVVQKIGRTEKFLCAMAVAPYIVTEGWVNDSSKAGRLLDETPYLLNDPIGEAKWNFKLADALARSRKHRSAFLKGHTFFVTKNTQIDKNLLKNIIGAHGGECFTQTINQRNIIGYPNRHVISDIKDKSIWRPLADAGVPIYMPELVITGVLVQEMEWNNNRLDSR